MPIYASPEQFMRDRSEYARKGISRGRSVVVMTFADGVLFVAENHQPSLHKVSEIYDRIGFAGVGRYNEFENLRTAGIRLADVRGFSYDRRDVNGRWLANAYAQTIGSIFSEHQKPFEVELCVAEVGPAPEPGIPLVQDESAPAGGHDQLYRISYDGSIVDERRFVVMGGATEPVVTALQNSFSPGLELRVALRAAVDALGAAGENAPRQLTPAQLEVAVLDRTLPGRTFRRLEAGVLGALLQEPEVVVTLPEGPVTDEPPAVSGSVRGDVPADDDASDGTPENGDTVR